ncbi:J domain-containing protein [Chloroflexota bacterium]
MVEHRTTDDEESLYTLLGVSSDASQSEIRAAYRYLAKQYHPDINPSAEASARMSEINQAYSILSDPAKRAAYDAGIELEGEKYETEDIDSVSYAQSFSRQVACQGCGRFDHTLRVVAFPYVISFLIVSSKRYEAGIFCNQCRSIKSTKWAVVSLLFGWWGFPFGIFWTIESLIVNFLKGKMPKEENKQLLTQIAWVSVVLGRINEAKAALRDLLKYGTNKEAKSFEDELNRNYPTVSATRVPGQRLGFVVIVGIILIVYGLIGNAIFGGSPQGNDNVQSPKAQVVSDVPAQVVPETSPRPNHNIPIEEVIEDSQYLNMSWDAIQLYRTISAINEEYYKEHVLIAGESDSDDMAIDIWNILRKQGITSIIVTGNLGLNNERFQERNHTWLLINHRSEDAGYRIFIVESTNGKVGAFDKSTNEGLQYLQGYYYSSPSDFKADIE